MRKVLLLIISILLIIPTVVFAEECSIDGVVVEKISRVAKSSSTKEVAPAKIENKKIYLNLEMNSVGDYITYEIYVKNGTEEDYVIDKSSLNNKYDYFEYTLDTNETMVKPGETKTIRLNVSYINEVAQAAYKEYVFSEKQNLNLLFNPTKIDINPPTGVTDLIYIMPVVFIVAIMIMISNKKRRLFKVISAFTIIIIPYVVNASCKCELGVESTITVNQCKMILKTAQGSFSLTEDVKEVCVRDAFDDYTFTYQYVWVGYPLATSHCTNLYVNIFSDYFTDESYVKVYSDSNKTNLAATITKDSFPKDYYNITNARKLLPTGVSVDLGSAREFSYELSPDLQRVSDEYYAANGRTPKIVSSTYNAANEHIRNISGWMTTSQDIITKIEDLNKSYKLINDRMELTGFVSCEEILARSSPEEYEYLQLIYGIEGPVEDICKGNNYYLASYAYTIY